MKEGCLFRLDMSPVRRAFTATDDGHSLEMVEICGSNRGAYTRVLSCRRDRQEDAPK